jgi:hypothetical protein
MRAMSVRQPWAWGIVEGGKPLENRGEKSAVLRAARKSIGEVIAIHASVKAPPLDDWHTVEELVGRKPPTATLMPLGRIVGVARIAGVVDSYAAAVAAVGEDGARWFAGPCAIVLTERRPIAEPVIATGFLHLWEIPRHLLADVLIQVRDA